jgi:hypothetical protein
MEPTELLLGEGVNRLRSGRISPHWPDGERRRVTDDRKLGKGNALMRFAPFTTINSVISNPADLRLQSHHVVGVPMEIRPLMTRRDVAPKHPDVNEGCEQSQSGTPRTPPARGPAVAWSRTDLYLNETTRDDGRLISPVMERTELMVWEGANRLRPGRYSRHRPDGESRRVPDYRLLWKETALMRCAHFLTINTFISNAAELRRHSRHVFGVPMDNRNMMTRPDVASELPQPNERCDPPQGATLRTPPARGTAVTEFKTDLHLNSNDAARRASEPTRYLKN